MSRFPTPLPVDPWLNIYLPARMGEQEAALGAIARVLASADAENGDVLAVVARALYVCGDPRAEALARRALRLGGQEALRLSVFVMPSGARTPEALCLLPAAVSADVLCDRAARALIDGDGQQAKDWIHTARTRFPEHAEARRWSRFLRDASDLPACLRYASVRRERWPDASVMRDAVALLALPNNGFVSPERWLRRHSALRCTVVRGSALERLDAAGVGPRVLSARALAKLGAQDPAVDLELRLDEAVSLVNEGRPAQRAVGGVLADAVRFTVPVLSAAAAVCAGLAMRDASLVAVVLPVVEGLMPEDPQRWTPWIAAIGCTVDPVRSARFARSLLADPGAGPQAARLACYALSVCGAPGEAQRLLARASG
jgi:hypothetical protein